MKLLWIAVSLLVSAGNLNAQPGNLYNAELIDQLNVQDPAMVVEQVQDGWFVFSVPAMSGSKSPCCWRGAWDGTGESGCSLKQEQHSFGTRSDSPDTSALLLYTRVTGGGVTDIRVMGEQCPRRRKWRICQLDRRGGYECRFAVASSSGGRVTV